MSLLYKKELIKYLRDFKLANRLNVFDEVLDLRTRYFTVVLENIEHSHNISAVLRSCECFGIQDVYIINDNIPFNLNKKVARGSFKWLTLRKFNRKKEQNSISAFNELKEKGYRIVATTPDPTAVSIFDYDILESPSAFVFGTELTGISKTIEDNADVLVTIPTVGFTQSLNISVSTAIILQIITEKLRKSNVNWCLNESEKDDLMLEWLRKSIPKVGLFEKRFMSQQGIELLHNI